LGEVIFVKPAAGVLVFLFLALALAACAGSSGADVPGSDVFADKAAVLVIRYCEAGTEKELADPFEISKTNAAITVLVYEYLKEISGYEYARSSVAGRITVEPGERAEVTRYYEKSGPSFPWETEPGLLADYSILTIKHFDKFSGEQIAKKETVYAANGKLEVDLRDHVREIENYSFTGLPSENFVVEKGESREVSLYYARLTPPPASAETVLTVYHYLEGTTAALALPATVTMHNAAINVKAGEHVKNIEGYSYVSSSPTGVFTVEAGKTGTLICYYKPKSGPAPPVASLIVYHYLEGTTTTLAPAETYSSTSAITVQTNLGVLIFGDYEFSSTDQKGPVEVRPGQTVEVRRYYKEKTPSSGTGKPAAPVLLPSAPGESTESGKYAHVDYSNLSQGYIMVSFTGASGKRARCMVTKDGQSNTYDLHTDGRLETIPMSLGDGEYAIAFYQFSHVDPASGQELWLTGLKLTLTVKLENEFLPFLYPNQYAADYNADSEVVAKARELCKNASNDVEKVDAVYRYVITNFKYDGDKAKALTNNEIIPYWPVVDETLAANKGICWDFAAVMVAMLRSQGVPVKLVTGTTSLTAGSHAWIQVYIQGAGWVSYKIGVNSKTWNLLDPTFAATSSPNSSNIERILNYVPNEKDYLSKKYF